MDSPASEKADGEGNYIDGRIDLAKLVRAVTNLARSTTDKESIHLIASSICLNPEEGREIRKTNDKFQTLTRKSHSEDQRAEKDDGNKRARKTVDKNVKSAKGRLVQIEEFECENCERCFGTVTSLKTHKTSCAQATDALKSTKGKCTLCNKEPTNIYEHYAAIHVIEDPEQIMFYGGNKLLVRSHIDTKGSKAPWFQKEEVKAMNKYDSLTCRLCVAEPKFCNAEILADHYTLFHMVAPAMLDILKRLFRAAKGAHLVDLSTSQTPSKRKSAASNPTPDKYNLNYDTGKTRFPCKQCKEDYSTKSYLKRHVQRAHLGKKPEEVVATEVVSNKNKNKEYTSKREAKREPKSKKPKCVLDDKELTTTHKHYGYIHNVECREQLFFVNENNVAISDIDTKGGKDPRFLRGTEKAKRYTPTTCRLCETEYDDPAVLENHYRSNHKVVPGALERLQHLFHHAGDTEEKRKRHRENQRAYYQRKKGLKKNDKNVEELSLKKLDDLQIKRKKLDSNEDQENVVQCAKYRKNSSQNLQNIQLDQNQFLTQQLRIYEESHECITPEVILHRNTDIPGDGNCLFHSLILVLQLQILTSDLRKQLRDSPYLKSCHNPQQAYNILSSNNEYGDSDCIYLFSKIYTQNICVHYHYFNKNSKNEDTRFCHFKENDTHNWIHLDLRDQHFTPYFSDDEKKKEDERKKLN